MSLNINQSLACSSQPSISIKFVWCQYIYNFSLSRLKKNLGDVLIRKCCALTFALWFWLKRDQPDRGSERWGLCRWLSQEAFPLVNHSPSHSHTHKLLKNLLGNPWRFRSEILAEYLFKSLTNVRTDTHIHTQSHSLMLTDSEGKIWNESEKLWSISVTQENPLTTWFTHIHSHIFTKGTCRFKHTNGTTNVTYQNKHAKGLEDRYGAKLK